MELHLGDDWFQHRAGTLGLTLEDARARDLALAEDEPPEVDYTLYVRTRDGRAERVGSWRSIDGRAVQLTSGTAADAEELESVEVRTASGRVVLRLVT